jgi:hypothetical protein
MSKLSFFAGREEGPSADYVRRRADEQLSAEGVPITKGGAGPVAAGRTASIGPEL